MRLEHIPLIIGVIVALIGLGFIADASMAASAPPTPDRRRRTRAEPSRAGEAVIGIGTLCMAAALFGRDTWRYGTVAVLAGSALLLVGIVLNRAFLKEALLFRGPARRAEEGSDAPAVKSPRPVQRAVPASAPPVERPSAVPSRPGGAARHPTPLASPVFRPPAPPPDAPASPPSAQRDGPPAKPSGSPERRRNPRGKRK